MEQKKLDEIIRLHKMWLNGEEEGERANLRYANLQNANLQDASLRGADLRDASLDYSCWPLWCGSLDVKVDRRIAAQLAYHFCRLDCDDPDYISARNAVINFADEFHRVKECGWLEPKEVNPLNESIYPELVGRICAIVELRESGKITIATAYKEIAEIIKERREAK